MLSKAIQNKAFKFAEEKKRCVCVEKVSMALSPRGCASTIKGEIF